MPLADVLLTVCLLFLLLNAAEVYPTSVRSTAHGVSAAVGKCGALVPTVLFNYIGNTTKFWVVCWAGLLGWFLTMLFIPDATGGTFEALSIYTIFADVLVCICYMALSRYWCMLHTLKRVSYHSS